MNSMRPHKGIPPDFVENAKRERASFTSARNRIEISTVFGDKGLTILDEDFGFFGKMQTDFSLRLSDLLVVALESDCRNFF
ncbi:hypothetical protein CH380_07495 [Leptospira adleri]|uniref:Uncharacterized protein n=1 Tax=Leptospira adleri TaxID=2023186 RepID=A0A2M9YQN0_9LEPT|nr:hypothetical protein CH380_07495 [Leptospira adleri]PJZ63136.1 hypothetical protein CH376_04630 [Leptospira adleri]